MRFWFKPTLAVDMKGLQKRLTQSIALILIGGSLSACGGSGSSSDRGNMPDDQTIDTSTIAGKLAALGIDTSQTPRLDTDGEALPETYAPMGSNASVKRFASLDIKAGKRNRQQNKQGLNQCPESDWCDIRAPAHQQSRPNPSQMGNWIDPEREEL
jgi:hypothetical protein